MTTSGKKSPSMLHTFTGITMSSAAIMMILFSGSANFSGTDVEKRLREFADYVSKRSLTHGREGQFSYGAMDLGGWGFDRFAVLNNVSLTLSEKELLDTTRWSVSTAKVQVRPDPQRPGGLKFIASGPVNVIKNSEWKNIISFDVPVEYGFSEDDLQQPPEVLHTVKLPGKISFEPPRGAGAPPVQSESVVVTLDQSSSLSIKDVPEAKTRTVEYGFNNVQVTSAGVPSVAFSSISGAYRTQAQDNNSIAGKYSWKLKDIVIGEGKNATTPYMAEADITYLAALPLADAVSPANAQVTPVSVEYTVEKVTLAGQDFSAKISGKVTSAIEELLPFGQLDVEVQNAGNLLNSALVPEGMHDTVAAVLQKIANQPVEPKSQLNFSLKRDKKGAFYVGAVTFEELTALVIRTMFKAPAEVKEPPKENENKQ